MRQITSCLRCEFGEQRLISAPGLMQMFCMRTEAACGSACGDFVQRQRPLCDPRGAEYSAAHAEVCAARQLCLRVLDGSFAYFIGQIRQRQGRDRADALEVAGREAWRTRAAWMTPAQLEAASRVRA